MLGKDHIDLANPLSNLAEDELEAGHPAAAIPWLRRADAVMRAALGPDHADFALLERAHGEANLAPGEPARAADHLEDALARLRHDDGANTDPSNVAPARGRGVAEVTP